MIRIPTTLSGRATSALLRVGVLALCALALYFNPFGKSQLNLWLGIALLLLTLQPLDTWLRSKQRKRIPILELHLTFYAICFGIAAFDTPSALYNPPLSANEYTVGLIATILGVVAVRFGYLLSQLSQGRFAARLCPQLPEGYTKVSLFVIYPIAALLSLLTTHYHVSGLLQPLEAIHHFAFAWLVCAALARQLSPLLRLVVYVGVIPLDFILFSGLLNGFLAGLLTYGELLAVAFIVYKTRIPILIPIAVVAVFFILQPGKSAFRDTVWYSSSTSQGASRLELFFSDAKNSSSPVGVSSTNLGRLNDGYRRLNHLYTTSAVISVASSSNLFLYGKTYLPLLTVWIPRAVWPNKPRQDIGNTWAKQYGLMSSSDNVTSYNLPWLPEMFINFGWPGILVISTFVGWLIGEFKRGVINRVSTPIEVAFALSIASTFFFPESNLSGMLGGAIIVWIVIAMFSAGLRTFVPARSGGHKSIQG